MKNKKTMLIIIIAIAILAAAVAVFAILNVGDAGEKRQSQANATVTIVQGDRTAQLTLDDLMGYGKTKFSTMQDTSETDPEEKSFTGVPLATVLETMGFSLDGAAQVVFSAADGYTTVVTADEARDVQNVYLVYERDGKPSGTMKEGGSGPIEIVIAQDPFAQRWCKYLTEIEIQ